MRELQKLKENILTNDILKPLLVRLGYDKVDYHGGTSEEGKDLICCGRDKFGNEELTVIQVKRYRPTAKAADRRSLSEIVTQLSQAAEKPVPMQDGTSLLPAEIVLITPYPINTRALQTRFEAVAALRGRKVKLLDGCRLAPLVLEHLPSKAAALVGSEFDIAERMRNQLNNDPLLNALGATPQRDISSFYTDIDFSVGSRATTSFFYSSFQPILITLTLRLEGFQELARVNREVMQYFGVSVVSDDGDAVLKKYAPALKKHENWLAATRSLREQISSAQARLASLRRDATGACRTLHDIEMSRIPTIQEYERRYEQLDDVTKKLTVRLAQQRRNTPRHRTTEASLKKAESQQADITREIDRLTQYDADDAGQFVVELDDLDREVRQRRVPADKAKAALKAWTKRHNARLSAMEVDLGHGPRYLRSLVRDYVSALADWQRAQSELSDRHGPRPEPRIAVSLNGRELAGRLLHYRNKISGKIEKFRKVAPSISTLRKFLVDCDRVLVVAELLLRNDSIVRALGVVAPTSVNVQDSTYRLRVPIHDVFETGINVAVLGEAGAGKTTSMQIYALKRLHSQAPNEVCLFVPLARLAGIPSRDTAREIPSEEHSQFERSLAAYLRSLEIEIAETDLIRLFKSREITLLLDGIDEAIKGAPWLMREMKELAARYDKLQIVTSSRIMERLVDRIPFLSVTLMPFTEKQLNTFLDLWFGSPRAANRIRIAEHLKESEEVADIARNPLLATMLCVLAEHDVDLPSSETRLYQERMKLLTGYYDLHKQIPRRVESQADDLLFIARKLAYAMHLRETRHTARQEAYDISLNSVKGRIPANRCRLAIDELVDPCNVLFRMPDEELSFGHLRYQEFLAAEEINTNRAIDIAPLLSRVWWRGALVLFARMNESLDWLVDLVMERQLPKSSLETIMAMIRTRSEEEQAELEPALQASYEGRFSELLDDDEEHQFLDMDS